MVKHIFRFPCPCCGEKVEYDTKTREARAASAEKPPVDLDNLLSEQKAKGLHLDDQFEGGLANEKSQKSRLDDLFDQAKDEAKDDTSKPPNPFDMD